MYIHTTILKPQGQYMLQNIYILHKCCSFVLSIHKIILGKNVMSHLPQKYEAAKWTVFHIPPSISLGSRDTEASFTWLWFTLVRFRFKTHNFCFGLRYAHRLNYSGVFNVENGDFKKNSADPVLVNSVVAFQCKRIKTDTWIRWRGLSYPWRPCK